jgi:hypothetical protein
MDAKPHFHIPFCAKISASQKLADETTEPSVHQGTRGQFRLQLSHGAPAPPRLGRGTGADLPGLAEDR